MAMERVIAVTPAGRRGYLELLAHYVLADPAITEWHLWDNCRQQSDRQYIHALAQANAKIKIITRPYTDGSNSSINGFYKLCQEADTFYIKMDDDLVYLPPGFGDTMRKKAGLERGRKLWWSPLVVNNAICTWLFKYFSNVTIEAEVTAQAACRVGWRSAVFAENLHSAFISALRGDQVAAFNVPDKDVMLSRFSINCIGFFGSDVATAGDDFCPPGVDDEEWLSAVLPARLNLPGRIIGDCIIAHFSYWTQEADLLKTRLLEDYYDIAGLQLNDKPVKKMGSKALVKSAVLNRFLGPPIPPAVRYDADAQKGICPDALPA